jgi:hypothetical protein
MQDDADADAELIGDIYEGSHVPELWNRALTAIRDRVGADVVVMLGVDRPTFGSELVAWTGLDPRMLADYAAYWGRHDPWPAAMLARNRPGEVRPTQDFMPPDEFRAAAITTSSGGLMTICSGAPPDSSKTARIASACSESRVRARKGRMARAKPTSSSG